MGRTVAVVLFTDLVGSTELRGRLGEEAADDLRRRHDQLLARAVEANNGRVVKGLGDGIMATFTGAADAVAAAVAIQQGIDRLNRSGKALASVAVRAGLAAGDVAVEDDDVHGTPVIEASRLCGAAAGGEILAAEVVRVLAGSSAEQSYVSVGPLQLKGLDHPVAAARVEWEPAIVSSIPMPTLLTDVGRIFVGRDDELERLGQLWKEAAAGHRRVALLAGEPGVGKTRLAAELAIRAHEEGGIVLAGRCDEDLGVPYQPFVEALRHFADNVPTSELKGRLGRYGGELVRLVPEVAERVPGLQPPLQSDPETERYRLFDAVAAWLAAASAGDPLLVVLDDLQWAARPSLLLLRHVVRAAEGARVLVVATYRDSELSYDHPLLEVLADLRRQRDVERIALLGLDQSGVAAFVAQASGHVLDDEALLLARAIYLETEGNPFFVREVLRHLAETGVVVRQGGEWSTCLPIEEVGIPEGVREVVGKRLARLSPGANTTLRMAAVVGAEFEPDVVRSAGGFDEEDLIAALEEATAARLVIESASGRYRFAHALVRDTLYNGLSPVRRVTLHRRVAESIETVYAAALDDHVSTLAHHWARSGAAPTEVRKAVAYATRAGDRALAQFANDEAVSYYRQALELLAAVPSTETVGSQDVDLLIALGQAEHRAGDPRHRATLLGAARLAEEQGAADALARAALANTLGAHASIAGRVDGEKVTVLEAALKAVPGLDSSMRARLLATLGLELTFHPDRRRRVELSDEALAMARRVGDPATLAWVLLARFITVLGPGTLDERLRNCDELIAVADDLNDPATRCRAWWLRFRALLEMGESTEADASLRVAERLSDELGQPLLRWQLMWSRAGLILLMGRVDEADHLFADSFAVGQAAGQPDAIVFYGYQAFEVALERGRFEDLDRQVIEELSQNAMPLLQAADMILRLEVGDRDRARKQLLRFADNGFGSVPVDPGWMRVTTLCAVAARDLGEIDVARALYDVLTPYASQLTACATVISGVVTHYLGILATVLRRFHEGHEYFAAAERSHAALRAPTWLARTRLEWARMLLTRRQPGDADRARELLGQALSAARELGLAKVERDAAALLGECP
jgi:class 3 adenylate cyclase